MAKQRVDIVVAAKDQASAKLLGIARAAAGMAVAFVSFRAIKAALTSVTAAYGIQEQAERKLQQALKATGGSAGFTFDQLKKYAASLQSVTESGSGATIEMMSLLATFGQVQGPVFTRATELILDVSKAMGQDLSSTARQVGRALNDPVQGLSALSRMGVTFSEQQARQIQAFAAQNDVASAQKIILDELAARFGGQAAAGAATFSGKLKQLANDFGDAKEQMGRLIASIPGLGTGVDWLRTVFQNLGLSMNLVWASAQLGVASLWEEIKFTFNIRIPTLTVWLVDNLKNIWTTYLNFQRTVFKNLFENFKNLFFAILDMIRGKEVDFQWTGLLDGFKSTLSELPNLVREGKTEVEKALAQRMDELMNQFHLKFEGIRNAKLEVPESESLRRPPMREEGLRRGGVQMTEAGRFALYREGQSPQLTLANQQLAQSRQQTQNLNKVAAGIQQILINLRQMQQGLAPLKTTRF